MPPKKGTKKKKRKTKKKTTVGPPKGSFFNPELGRSIADQFRHVVHQPRVPSFALLKSAVSSGDVFAFSQIAAEHEIDVNDTDMLGTSLLHMAVSSGSLPSVKLLLSRGASLNAQTIDTCGRKTPLHIAACRNLGDIAEELLSQEADPNVQDFQGQTPLFSAVRNQNLDMVKLLLEWRCNTAIKDQDGLTAEYWAKKLGFHEIASLLPPQQYDVWVQLKSEPDYLKLCEAALNAPKKKKKKGAKKGGAKKRGSRSVSG